MENHSELLAQGRDGQCIKPGVGMLAQVLESKEANHFTVPTATSKYF